MYLRKKVHVFTQVFTSGGIYLFTNKIITHFGSNFLNISWLVSFRRFASRKNEKTFK